MRIMAAILNILKKVPLDLGQGELRYKTEGKQIALRYISAATAGQRALDIGCRDGHFSELLKKRGYRVDSLDIKKEYQDAQIVDANVHLPWEDGTFDLIWCSEVIEHLKDPAFSINEFRRVLKTGGGLIITTPNSGCWVYRLFSLIGLPPKKLQNPDHKHFLTLADILRLFPYGKVSGYFPYMILKFEIQHFLGFLTPTFVILEKKR